jgi:hypothetical protein
VLQENKFQGTYLSKDYYYRDSLGRITDSIPTAWDLILVDSEGNYLLRSRPGKLEIYETIPAIEELLKLVLREDSLLHVEQEKRYMLLRHSMEPKKYNVMKNCHADIYIK